MRTCALSYQIKGPQTVSWLFSSWPVLATFTVVGPIIWCDNPQVRMWKILYINDNDFHHLGRSQLCAGAWYVFSPSKPHSGTLWDTNRLKFLNREECVEDLRCSVHIYHENPLRSSNSLRRGPPVAGPRSEVIPVFCIPLISRLQWQTVFSWSIMPIIQTWNTTNLSHSILVNLVAKCGACLLLL